MNKIPFFKIILLTAVWVVLRESVSLMTVVTGLAVSVGCVLLYRFLIPLPEMERVKPLRLLAYFFYLIGQVYVGGIAALKMVLFGAHVEIVELKTKLTSRVLRTLLVNSITLVPGSISLDLTDDTITVLWLTNISKGSPDLEKADEVLKGRLERMLIKAQK